MNICAHFVVLMTLLLLSACGSDDQVLYGNLEFENVEKRKRMLSGSKNPYVVRTFFKDDTAWESISRNFISKYEMGFRANLDFLNDRKYEGFTVHDMVNDRLGEYDHDFIFIADSITMESEDHSLICIDLYDEIGRSFRVVPSELWAVENNLSISNMDFVDFYINCDEYGVFRGFD